MTVKSLLVLPALVALLTTGAMADTMHGNHVVRHTVIRTTAVRHSTMQFHHRHHRHRHHGVVHIKL